MRDAGKTSVWKSRKPTGFSLVELLVVLAIIGILLSFILIAAMDGIRSANRRATQGLITKLETGLMGRLDAVLSRPILTTQTHINLAGFNTPYYSAQRAFTIARADYVRAEFPDVFFVQDSTLSSPYPLNFAGRPWTLTGSSLADYVLPIGAGATGTGTGIYGASYSAAAGVYKQLGYLPQGYDGNDNNGNGMVDEAAEGVNATNQSQIIQRLQAHRHKTARSEMLYAILVEGQGSLGTVFKREDFTDREVGDTDGDGLLEFLDAWGEPLQFYRWPIYHHTDRLQKGLEAYNFALETREQNPLDPNQQLVAPAWWSDVNNPPNMSNNAQVFQNLFFGLLDPQVNGASGSQLWDRGGYYQRREFFSKFLIVSSGADKLLGVAQFTDSQLYDNSIGPVTPAAKLVLVENQASAFDPVRPPGAYSLYALPGGVTIQQQKAAEDDFTNQELSAPGGGTK